MPDESQAAPQSNPLDSVEITLKLPVVAVNAILTTLAKLPYEQSAALIFAIRQQGDPQTEAARQALATSQALPPGTIMASAVNANRKARRKAAKKH